MQLVGSFGTLDKRSRELRQAKGLAQDQLAIKARLNPSYVGFIKRGERNPTLETIRKLAKVLEVDPKELFEL